MVMDFVMDVTGIFLFFSFGKRSAGSFRRGCECIVLEPSEMIVVRIFSCNFFNVFFSEKNFVLQTSLDKHFSFQ